MKLYVTEPEVINLSLLKALLEGSQWEAIEGSADFETSQQPDVQALLIRSQTEVDESALRHFPNLKHVIRVGTGLDNVDLDFCERAGIAVHSAPGANSGAVAEYTIMMMMMALRKLSLLSQEKVAAWDRAGLEGQSLAGKTVGIVGLGNIGKRVKQRLAGFECREVLVHDPALEGAIEGATKVSLEDLVERSDVISLHVPLTQETKHLIGESEMQKLKAGVVLINAARGGLVDEMALLRTIGGKRIFYVADSVENEPQVRQELLNHPQVMLTPHIAGYTEQASEQALRQAIESFLKN